jgi:hypothetical protein
MPFVSQVLGRAVLDPDGFRIGALRDLLVAIKLPYPPVLTLIDHELRPVGVDNSTAGLLRRLGLQWMARPFGGTPTKAHALSRSPTFYEGR